MRALTLVAWCALAVACASGARHTNTREGVSHLLTRLTEHARASPVAATALDYAELSTVESPEIADTSDRARTYNFAYAPTSGFGPASWGMYSKQCEGALQSPIDLRPGSTASDYAAPSLAWQISRCINATVERDRVSVRAVCQSTDSSVILDGKRYSLRQLHFHTPSEHTIDGKALSGELHAVFTHQEPDDGSLKYVYVALLLQESRQPSSDKSGLWELLEKGSGDKESGKTEDGTVHVTQLFPAGTTALYTYKGSLTAPPCTSSVTWFIVKTPLQVTSQQLSLVKTTGGPNSRPVQKVADRAVASLLMQVRAVADAHALADGLGSHESALTEVGFTPDRNEGIEKMVQYLKHSKETTHVGGRVMRFLARRRHFKNLQLLRSIPTDHLEGSGLSKNDPEDAWTPTEEACQVSFKGYEAIPTTSDLFGLPGAIVHEFGSTAQDQPWLWASSLQKDGKVYTLPMKKETSLCDNLETQIPGLKMGNWTTMDNTDKGKFLVSKCPSKDGIVCTSPHRGICSTSGKCLCKDPNYFGDCSSKVSDYIIQDKMAYWNSFDLDPAKYDGFRRLRLRFDALPIAATVQITLSALGLTNSVGLPSEQHGSLTFDFTGVQDAPASIAVDRWYHLSESSIERGTGSRPPHSWSYLVQVCPCTGESRTSCSVCNNQGECISSGYCKCNAMYWGLDCSQTVPAVDKYTEMMTNMDDMITEASKSVATAVNPDRDPTLVQEDLETLQGELDDTNRSIQGIRNMMSDLKPDYGEESRRRFADSTLNDVLGMVELCDPSNPDVPACGVHMHCMDGVCVCLPGWKKKGPDCEKTNESIAAAQTAAGVADAVARRQAAYSS